VAAVRGLCRAEAGRLRDLLACWLLAAAALGLLAVVTPLAFRFEYFAAPAGAMAAGLGAESWRDAGRGRWVAALWAVSFALQCAIGVLLLFGRFEIISVIIPSPRWAWPFRIV
jgi:hypothetical protein